MGHPGSRINYRVRVKACTLFDHLQSWQGSFILASQWGTEGSKVSIHMCRTEAELSRHMQALGDSLLPGIWGK